MTSSAVSLRWDKPGPGAWRLDSAHNLGPLTRIMQDIFPTAMADGFRSCTGRYGLPISHIDVRYVNGFAYGSVRIAGIPASDAPPPPARVLRVLTRLHPAFLRRNRQARRALDGHLWNEDLRTWFDRLRPARLAAVRALQDVDPAGLSDAELADHVERCVATLADGLREHHSMIGASAIPIGLHLVQQEEMGRSAEEAISDLAGAAAASTGATIPALAAVAEAVAAADVVPTTLDDVRRASPEAAAALDAYLADYGQRVVGALDVTGRRLVELPDVVLKSILAARNPGEQAPVRHADPVLAEARLAAESRDDHAGISCMWPLGLTRRALLEAGARLVDAGLIDDAGDVLDASVVEVRDLLNRSSTAPTAAELARRSGSRRALVTARPPALLGADHPPPDPSSFPPAMARMTAAMGAFLRTMSSHDEEATGVGIGGRAYRGRAVVASSPEDAILRVEPDDVLITTTTTPAFNSVLPIVGALVTAHGGLMSHAGIAARELNIPAVVGVADVLERIPDGAEVEVDPVAGTVRVMSERRVGER